MTTDSEAVVQHLGQGIHRVDTGLYRTGLASCYLIREGDQLVFVDTGTSNNVPMLLELTRELGLSPEHVDFVIPTHVHLDHAGGSGALMAQCPNATLVIHPKGAPHMIDPSRLTEGATAVYGEAAFARDFGRLEPVAEDRVVTADDGLEIVLGDRRLVMVHSPGHANHHFCVFDSATRGFFSGDTFGISYRELDTGRGPYLFAPTTPVAFDPDAWLESIDKLLAFDPQAMYLTHFGRLPDPEAHADTLRASIRALADIALEEESRDDEGRSERLQAAVSRHLIERALRHGCTLGEERIGELLSVDADLNAQGLEVWLKRREKARAA